MQVFYDVKAYRLKLREEDIKALALMGSNVGAVIQHNIRRAQFEDYLFQEQGVILRANTNLIWRGHVTGTIWVDVYPEDRRSFPEILAPHFKGTALEHANFKHFDRRIAIRRKMALVDFKKMHPLMNHASSMSKEHLSNTARDLARQSLSFMRINSHASHHLVGQWRRFSSNYLYP